MTAAARRRWPSESALKSAIAAVSSACGTIGGVRVHADGSFDVLAPGEISGVSDDPESRKIAERIRNAGRSQ